MKRPDVNFQIPLASGRLRGAFSPVGASLASLEYKMKGGAWRPVALSPLAHRTGESEPALAGRTVGPCCGRVRGAEMALGDRTCPLDANENGNHLHGGFRGVANRRWEVVSADDSGVCFALTLPDGEGGYPGNRRLEVCYKMEDDALTVRYSAVTDAPSWLCLTNHAYWDLTGRFDGSAMEQLLQIPAGRAVFNDGEHLPVAIRPVDGTPFDFRSPTSPAEQMRRFPDHPQLAIAKGFNNALLPDDGAPFAARLSAPDGSIAMTMTTDYPALVFYSGGFLGGDTVLEGGAAVPGAALALEAQTPPDPFHLPGVEPEPFLPGAPWRHFIRWAFES